MAEWKIGDVVVLKSGGPAMTIIEKTIGGQWHTQWMAGTDCKEGWFPPEALKEYVTPTVMFSSSRR